MGEAAEHATRACADPEAPEQLDWPDWAERITQEEIIRGWNICLFHRRVSGRAWYVPTVFSVGGEIILVRFADFEEFLASLGERLKIAIRKTKLQKVA